MHIYGLITDPKFLGVKAWELCLAFVLSVGFEEESGWNNDTYEDLLYKADKVTTYKKFASPFVCIRNIGIGLLIDCLFI